MNCRKCNFEMEFIGSTDTGTNGDGITGENRAYNIYHCSSCMIICREDVWQRSGNTWLFPDNNLIFDPVPSLDIMGNPI